jgi:hypothetical protein
MKNIKAGLLIVIAAICLSNSSTYCQNKKQIKKSKGQAAFY